MKMKEIARNLENLLAAAYRRQDCPAPETIRELLLGKDAAAAYTSVLEHVKSCCYCQGEIMALAQISDIAIPAELFGYDDAALAQIEEKARRTVHQLAPRELPGFASLWQLALVHGSESGERMPLAAAAFSSSSRSRAARLIHAALLLGTTPDAARLDEVVKTLHLNPKERAVLTAEFLH